MAWNFTDRIRALRVGARPAAAAEAQPLAPDVGSIDVARSDGVSQDISGPDVAKPVAVKAAQPSAKRRLSKVSDRLSHALFAGVIALAFLPPTRPNAEVKPATALPAPSRAPALQSGSENLDVPPAAGGSRINERSVPIQAIPMPVEPKPQAAPAAPSQSEKSSASEGTRPTAAPQRMAAMVAPVKRESPKTIAITVTPDEPRRVEARSDAVAVSKPDLKLPKGKMKLVRARPGAPSVTIKSIRPPDQTIVVASVTMGSVAAVEPELLSPATEKLPKLNAKTISERKAKLADAPKPQRVVTIEPAAPPATPPAAGVATRREETTVVEAWSADQIADGRKACQSLLKDSDVVASDAPPLKEGACGAPAPVVVRRLGAPKVDVQPAAMMTCPMAASLNTWITKAVQPAALENFGVPVVRLLSASSYSCRNRYGQSNTQLSEHALVNALDLSGFVLADGRTIRVVDSWGAVARDAKPEPVKVAANEGKPGIMRLGVDGAATPAAKAEPGTAKPQGQPDVKVTDAAKRSAFLRKVHQDACGTFGTVLGPEANDAHRNHFHLDMMARRHTSFCQ